MSLPSTPYQSPFLIAGVGLVGLIPTLAGLNAIFRPRSALALLEFSPPSPEATQAQRFTDPLMQMNGFFHLGLGLSTLAVWYSGDRKTLGWVMLAQGVVALGNGFVSKSRIGSGHWNHWGFLPVEWGLGVVLLEVLD